MALDRAAPASLDAPEDAPEADAAAKARALADAAAKARAEIDLRAFERLWLALQRTSCMSIALVPIGEGIDTSRLASVLASVGRQHLGKDVGVLDARKVSIATLQSAVSALIDTEGRVIIALSPLGESPAGVELSRAADAVVLCLSLGESAVAEAERVVADVGAERVLGAVIVRRGDPKHG